MSGLKKVGLTGGIGCGKSVVRRMLAEDGFATIDADSLAKELAERDPGAAAAIRAEFGEEMYDESGTLQRARLAAVVFADAALLKKLNAILHPRVMREVELQAQQLAAAGEPVVIIEAALFYETGWDRAMDWMVVVWAPLERRLQWLQQRDGATREQIEARMRYQMPLEEKKKRADYVIDNSGSLEDLRVATERFEKWLREKIG